jgi:hypothetical protein
MKQLQIEFIEWYPLPNFEGHYEINKNGDVRNKKNKKILKPVLANNGYYMVAICINYKVTNLTVHRLKALAFIPNPNNYPVVNHIDEDRLNNDLPNLEWCTYSHNNRESFINKAKLGKKRLHGQKFTVEEVLNIRQLQKSGVTMVQIAKDYKTKPDTIGNIVHRRTWNYEGL